MMFQIAITTGKLDRDDMISFMAYGKREYLFENAKNILSQDNNKTRKQ